MSEAMPLLVRDLIDADDMYTFSMGWLVQRWPEAVVTYRYINRDPSHRFRRGIAGELRKQVERLSDLSFSDGAFAFFQRAIPELPRPYLQWLKGYRLDPGMVTIEEREGRLEIEVTGRWYEAIYWEIKLLASLSELAHRDPRTGAPPPLLPGWEDVIHRKAEDLSKAGVRWVDFGTRRRYSYEAQDAVVRIMREYPGFLGTSNPYLAMKYDVKPVGTYAHQLPMALQALYGPLSADRMTMQHWVEAFRGNLGIALSDTLSTESFLREFDSLYASIFRGVRQDSGDPIAIGERLVRHYEDLGIDPLTKTVVFSDQLDTELAVKLHRHFEGRVQTMMGIGTFLTGDRAMTGVKPLNNVIKLTAADFGEGKREVVKLSDDPAKHSGDPVLVAAVRTLIGV